MKLKLSLLLVLIITYSWSQTTKTFLTNGSFTVPPGVTNISVQAWGGGGSGGGAVGAGLLFGRGAAGGGGGGYASSPLTVTPGTTLNVVVAGQTLGTLGANGSTGGKSTISGYEFFVSAVGGSGGGANNAGGTPIGGAGGITNSTGTVTIAGFNGGNGNSWSLLSLLLSSGPGGAGANFGGAGGSAVPSLILGTAPGNAGSSPGGGGSGAINSALGTAQAGGAGAAGKVIISYTCPVYNITATTAANVCASTGTSSEITLTSTEASLPIGNYIVTYNRSSPNATAITANLTVSTAGTGTFTATGLNTVGNSVITITNIASDTCSSGIISNNTATVNVSPATVGGTVSGGTTINEGNTSGLLSLSGNTGSVIKWQSSVSPFSTWADIANTTATYTSGALTETTQFRAVIQSGVCAIANSAATTVTVNPKPTIALASTTSNICSDIDGVGQNTTLSYSATTGNPITYSIVWNASPSNSFVAVTNAALPASPITILVPGGTAAGTYTGTLTVKNANGTVSLGAAFTLKVKQTASIISNDIVAPVNTSTSVQYTTLAYSGIIGNPTGYSLLWDQPVMEIQNFDPFSFSSSGGVINNIKVPANVPAGTYTGAMNFYSDGCYGSHYVSIVINNPAPTIALASAALTRCSTNDDSASSTILEYTATTETPTTYSIVWDSSPDNAFVAVTDAALPASPITIAIPAGVIPGTYTGTLTVKNANGAVSNTGSSFTITINETPLITTTGTIDAVYSSASLQNATLAYSGVSGSPVSYFIDWNGPANAASLADQPSTPFAFESWGGTINTIEISPNVPAGTYTGILYIFNGVCNQSQFVNVTINSVPSINLSPSAQAVCQEITDQYTPLLYNGATDSPVTYSIVWDSSPANNFVAVTDAALPASPIEIAIPAGVIPGTYTGTLTVKNANGAVSSPGSSFTVTINETPLITTWGIIDAVCSSTNPQNGVLTFTDFEGNPTDYSIDWDGDANAASLADQTSTPFDIDPNGSITTIHIPANVPSGTYSGIMSISNGVCGHSQPVSITINPAPGINLSPSAQAVCQEITDQYTPLLYNGATDSPVTYSIVWDSSPANNFVAVTDDELFDITINVLVPENTVPGTYTGTLSVKNANGCVSPGYPFSVTVNTQPTITTTGTIVSVSTSNSIQNTTLAYTASTNISSGEYLINWDEDLFTDQSLTSATFVSGGGVINNIEIPANIPAGTYSGTMLIFSESCSISQPVSITINPVELPTIALASLTDNVCGDRSGSAQNTTLGYKGTTGNPITYSIVWDSSPANSFVAVVDAALPASPITIEIPAGTVSGTYTGTLIVKDANDASSLGKTFNVNVGVAPSITIYDSIRSVCSSTSFQNATLQYARITGDPTSYYIDWDETANAALLQDQSNTPHEFDGIGGLIESIEIPANVPEGTYSGTMYVVDGICAGSHPVSIVINPSSKAPIIGQVTNANNSHPGSVALSGLPLGNWVIVNNLDQVESGSGTSTIFTVDGGMTYTFTVTPEGGCPSPESQPVFVGFQFGNPVSKQTPSAGATDPEFAENKVSVAIDNKVINVEAPDQIINEVYIFDVSGNLLYKKDAISDSKLVINNLRSSNQVLVVRVILNNNRVATKKVIY